MDVDERFVEGARRIHYGEVEERAHLRGRASHEEAEALREEGIEVAALLLLDAFKGPDPVAASVARRCAGLQHQVARIGLWALTRALLAAIELEGFACRQHHIALVAILRDPERSKLRHSTRRPRAAGTRRIRPLLEWADCQESRSLFIVDSCSMAHACGRVCQTSLSCTHPRRDIPSSAAAFSNGIQESSCMQDMHAKIALDESSRLRICRRSSCSSPSMRRPGI